MENHSFPEISSFVLRFVREDQVGSNDRQIFRGFIQHIQTDQKISFTHWEDAMKFISQFVPGEVLDLKTTTSPLDQGCEEPE
jgi:hypothetical protein